MTKTHCDVCDATPAFNKIDRFVEITVNGISHTVRVMGTFEPRYRGEDSAARELCADCQRKVIGAML